MLKSFKRGLVLLLLSLLLAFLASRANSFLSTSGVWVVLAGLIPAYAAVRLPRREGFTATFAAGLLADVHTPLPFGCIAFLMSAAYVLAYAMRHRFRSRKHGWIVALAVVLNALIIAGVSGFVLFFKGHFPALPPLLAATTASSLLLAILGFWLLELCDRSLGLIGAPVASDELK